jgi:hypothetical protein
MARRAQLDLRQSETFFARKHLSFLTPKILLRAARVYSATPPLYMDALFENQSPLSLP